MANTKREKLFTEFPPVPTEKWEEVITADLKGADYERKLVWKTGEGFNVRPYYRAENLEGIKFLGSQAGEFPYVRGTRAHNRWRVHQTVSVVCPKEANAEALKILSQRRSADSSEAVLLGDAGRFYHDVVFHIRSPQTVSMKFFSILLNSMMLIASRTRVIPQLRR